MDVRGAERRVNAKADELAERAEAAEARRRASVEMLRRHDGRRRSANRALWIDYHRRQMVLFDRLSAEHRQAMHKLIDGEGGGTR